MMDKTREKEKFLCSLIYTKVQILFSKPRRSFPFRKKEKEKGKKEGTNNDYNKINTTTWSKSLRCLRKNARTRILCGPSVLLHLRLRPI
jgi:hypothetical protein|tara:strand:+ start:1763 stop:2029 length:267 start_codon:yes stop_codon:yes gene_type:complete